MFNWLDEWLHRDCRKKIADWKHKAFSCHDDLMNTGKERDGAKRALETANEELNRQRARVEKLEEKLNEPNEEEKLLEEHWNTKYPTKIIKYAGRSFPNNPKSSYSIDVRYFFQCSQPLIEIVEANKLNTGTYDERALKCLKWVRANIKYASDQSTFGAGEYWSFPAETLYTKKGDCVAEYEEIITKNGLKQIKDIKEGELILSYDFEKKEYCYKPVTKIWDKGEMEIKRVHFRNGQIIDVTESHPLWVRTNQKYSKYEKKYLKDIDLTRWWKRKVPVAKKIPYEIKDVDWLTEDKCFIIGHYVAEGWYEDSHVCTSGYDCDIIAEKLEKEEIPFGEGKNGNGIPIIRIHKSEFKEFLKKIKRNSFDIALPKELFALPENKIRAFLEGYKLGDGGDLVKYEIKRGLNCKKEYYYSTSSDQLAKDLTSLHLQIGEPLYVWLCKDHKGAGNKPIWRLVRNPNSAFCRDFGFDGVSEVSISFIEDVEKAKVKDIQVQDTSTFFFRNGICSHNCDSGAILLANLMTAAKIPYWRIRLNAGNVKNGGHAYVTYCRESDNEFVVLDWCYWYNSKHPTDRKLHSEEKDYYGIWFSLNKLHAFGKMQTMKGIPKDFEAGK